MALEVKMDGKEIAIPPFINNLEELLLHLMVGEIEPDTEVVEVRVNGETFSEVYEHQARSVGLKDMRSVEILTQKSEDLASRFIEHVPIYIEQLKKGFSTSANLLRDFEMEGQGHEMLAQSVETLKAFLDHMNNITGVIQTSHSAKIKESSEEFVEKFHGLAEEIITSQEEMDSMLVSDLIEYELVPLLDEWKERLKDCVREGR